MRTGDGTSCLTLKTSLKEFPLLLSLNPGLVKYVESSTTFHLISALAEMALHPWMIMLEVVEREREMENRGRWQWVSCNPMYARARAYKPLNMPYSPYFSKANSPTKTNNDFQQGGFTLEPFHIVTWTEVSKKFSHIRWKDVLHFILSGPFIVWICAGH